MDVFDLDGLLAQLVLALGAALVAGNGYALLMAGRGVAPKDAQGELRRGRAWFLLAVGTIMLFWGLATVLTN